MRQFPGEHDDFKWLNYAHHHPTEEIKATPLSKPHSPFFCSSQIVKYASRPYYNMLYYDGHAETYLLLINMVIGSLLHVEKHRGDLNQHTYKANVKLTLAGDDPSNP